MRGSHRARLAPLPDHHERLRGLIDQMTGLVDHASLETDVAWARDLFERIDVDGVEQRAVAPIEGANGNANVRMGHSGHLVGARGVAPPTGN